MTLPERITGWLSAPLNILQRHRIIVKTLLHVAIFVFAYLGAYLVRFDGVIPPEYLVPIRQTIPAVLASKALAFLVFGLFHGWWRYASVRDVLPIAGGCTLGSQILWMIDTFAMTSVSIPRSGSCPGWAT